MENLTTRMVYRCMECSNHVTIEKKGEKPPICCGKRMELTPPSTCNKDPAWAEHARLMDSDDPCQL
jgi:hypothetical protein